MNGKEYVNAMPKKSNKKIISFPQYITTRDNATSVIDTITSVIDNNGQFINGKGYVDDRKERADGDYDILIYSENKPKYANKYPYFWFNEDNEIVVSDPSDEIKEAFNMKKLLDMSLYTVIENTNEGEVLLDEDAIVSINEASGCYIPDFNEDDDFLKKIVKSIILKMGIDINSLKSKTENSYNVPNLKSALTGQTKMSVKYFNTWMNLLGCNFQMTITNNNEPRQYKLPHPIVYQSWTDSTYEVDDRNNLKVITKDTDTTEKE